MTAEEKLVMLVDHHPMQFCGSAGLARDAIALLRRWQTRVVIGHWQDCAYLKSLPCNCGWLELYTARDEFLDGEKP